MTESAQGPIAIDDLVEAASAGVLRALEAREIRSLEFVRDNGFFVKIDIIAGGYPGPIEKMRGGRLGEVTAGP